jgi:hypothetical protein
MNFCEYETEKWVNLDRVVRATWIKKDEKVELVADMPPQGRWLVGAPQKTVTRFTLVLHTGEADPLKINDRGKITFLAGQLGITLLPESQQSQE